MKFQPQGEPYEWQGYVPGTTVYAQINAIGGGTPPLQYAENYWEYVLRDTTSDGPILMEGTDLFISYPVTHAMAACVAFEYLPEEDVEHHWV